MKKNISKRSANFLKDHSVEITIAPNAGACFGVVRAIKLGEQAIARVKNRTDKRIHSLGPLIHNPQVVADLERQGIKIAQDAQDITGGTVILRSHGVQKETEADLRARGLSLIDATCPLVKKPQRTARALGEKGYFLILVGDANHPEVKGVISYFGKPHFLVTYDPNEIDDLSVGPKKIGIIAQTTIESTVLEAVVQRCKKRFNDVTVFNTICDATSIRQTEAEILAKDADIIIVVGGRNSSNTKKLEKICKDQQAETHLVEELEEIDASWFDGKKKIGVLGGASTPQEYVDRVGEHIGDLLEQKGA